MTGLGACRTRGRPDAEPSAGRGRTRAIVPGVPFSNTDGGAGIAGSETIRGAELRACIARVERATPPEVAAVLLGIEYESAAEDGCRTELAAHARDRELCDGVTLAPVRDLCRERVAIARRQPETCPPSRGRGLEPVCVALALRDVSLCTAASLAERVRCVAMARLDERACETLDRLLQTRCRRDVRALQGLVEPMRGEPRRDGTVHVRLAAAAPSDAGVIREWELAGAARGAFVDEEGVLYLVDPDRGWPGEYAALLEEPIVGVAIAQPERAGEGRVVDARVVLPDGRMGERSAAMPPGEAVLRQVGRVPGASVEGEGRAAVFVSGVPVLLDVRFDTFVRAVSTRAALR